MAGESLLEALQRSQYKVENNPYAAIGVTLANQMPTMYNPYANNGKNLAIQGGMGLLAALVGGYGRRQNDADNVALLQSASSLMGTNDASERQMLVKQNPRLVEFAAALKTQELENQLELAKERQKQAIANEFNLISEKEKAKYAQFPMLTLSDEEIASMTGKSVPQEIPTEKGSVKSMIPNSGIASTPEQNAAWNSEAIELPSQPISAPGTLLNSAFSKNPKFMTKDDLAIQTEQRKKAALREQDIQQTGFDKEVEGAVDSLRKEYNSLQDVKDFAITKKAADAMSGALKDKKAVTDLELTRYAILMIEPGMAVREGEQAAVLKSGSLPTQWKGTLDKVFTGESALTPEIRSGLLNLAKRAYNAQKSNYDKAYDFYRKEAENKKIDPNRVAYLGQAPADTEIFAGIEDPKYLRYLELKKKAGQ